MAMTIAQIQKAMETVTVEEAAFAKVYAETGDAVLAWYKCFQMPEDTPRHLAKKAAENVLAEPKIKMRVALERTKIIEKSEVTMTKLLTMAMKVHDIAIQKDKTLGVALNAISLMAKLVGVEKPETLSIQISPEEVLERLAFMAKKPKLTHQPVVTHQLQPIDCTKQVSLKPPTKVIDNG